MPEKLKIPKPFESRSTGSDGKPYVKGPGSGFGHDSGTLYPSMRLSTTEDADAAAIIANEAFAHGVHWARAQMRESLGLR